jgi:hypothetical protein
MHFLTSLIILVGFALVVFVGLVTVIGEVSQLNFRESRYTRKRLSRRNRVQQN